MSKEKLLSQQELDIWNLRSKLKKEEANLDRLNFEFEVMRIDHKKQLEGKNNSIKAVESKIVELEEELEKIGGIE